MQDIPDFSTDITYHDRRTKHQFVADKYASILKGRVLDVGADALHMKEFLPATVEEYIGVGLGDYPDQVVVDLEKSALPFPEKSFDLVMCLDVLEHLDNTHAVFDELCRVSRDWVLISLPNPYSALAAVLDGKKYHADRNTKFYGLPLDAEGDRHKWFYSSREAREYVNYRAEKNGFEVVNTFTQNSGGDGLGNDLLAQVKRKARSFAFPAVDWAEFYEGSLWWVLKRK